MLDVFCFSKVPMKFPWRGPELTGGHWAVTPPTAAAASVNGARARWVARPPFLPYAGNVALASSYLRCSAEEVRSTCHAF